MIPFSPVISIFGMPELFGDFPDIVMVNGLSDQNSCAIYFHFIYYI